MPIYEYECAECGKHFDEIQKFSDDALTQCKFCGGPVRKLLGAPALQFKGTGWYITTMPERARGRKAGATRTQIRGKPKKKKRKRPPRSRSPPPAPSCPSGTCAAAKADK